MAGTDYFTVLRRLLDSDRWLCERFSRGQAWVDLIGKANWKGGFVLIRGQRIDLNRGQLAASVVWLSDRWQWSQGKVRRFLNELETEGQIEQQKNNVTTVITITNYDRYQLHGSAGELANGEQTEGQTETEEKETRKNKKKQEGPWGVDQIHISDVTEIAARVFRSCGYSGTDGRNLWKAAAACVLGRISEAELWDACRGAEQTADNPPAVVYTRLQELLARRGASVAQVFKSFKIVPSWPKGPPDDHTDES